MAHPEVPAVRLLFMDGCPHWRIAAARLRAAMIRAGADPGVVVYEEVTTVEQAERIGFGGSPTVLVDGTDPFAHRGYRPGLACRVYWTAAGTEPAPTVSELQAVLSR